MRQDEDPHTPAVSEWVWVHAAAGGGREDSSHGTVRPLRAAETLVDRLPTIMMPPMQKMAAPLALASALCHIATIAVIGNISIQPSTLRNTPAGSHRALLDSDGDSLVTVAQMTKAVDHLQDTLGSRLTAVEREHTELKVSINALKDVQAGTEHGSRAASDDGTLDEEQIAEETQLSQSATVDRMQQRASLVAIAESQRHNEHGTKTGAPTEDVAGLRADGAWFLDPDDGHSNRDARPASSSWNSTVSEAARVKAQQITKMMVPVANASVETLSLRLRDEIALLWSEMHAVKSRQSDEMSDLRHSIQNEILAVRQIYGATDSESNSTTTSVSAPPTFEKPSWRRTQGAEPEPEPQPIGENVKIIKPTVVRCGGPGGTTSNGHFDYARCSDRAFAVCHAEACDRHRRAQAGDGYEAGTCEDLESMSAAVTRECCDEPGEDCTGGYPHTCNAGCAAVFLSFWSECESALGKSSRNFEPVVALCNAAVDSVRPSLAEQLNVQCTDGTPAEECIPDCSELYHGYLLLLNLDGEDSKLSCELHHGQYSWCGAAVRIRLQSRLDIC
jgi:hypothetical protein